MRSVRSSALIATVLVVAACTEKIIEAPLPPDAPTSLQAVVVPPKSIRLTWTAAPEASGYSVYRNSAKIGDVTSPEFVDADLASNTTYSWFVVARTSDGRVSAPSEPVTLGFGDITPPTVVSSTPAPLATGISRLPAPSVTFSEDMIPTTLSGGLAASVAATGEPIYGTVKYDPATRTADFWPLALLPARTAITLSVTNLPRDVAGNPAAPFSLTFTTGDTPAGAADLLPSVEPLLVSGSSVEFGQRDLFKLRSDGTGRINITNNSGSDLQGAWSPDGRHVAFASDRNGTFDVYIMREDGTGLRQLTFDAKDQTNPTWSPDARRIVFVSTRDGVPPIPTISTPGDLWSMNADGSAQVNLSVTPLVYEWSPQWSPDSQRLLFKRTELGVTADGLGTFTRSNQFMIANADGTAAKPLKVTDPRFYDDAAAWSPDGTQVAYSVFDFDSPLFSEFYLLFLINADGTNLRQLTTGGARRRPAWSPDGGSLVFSLSGFDEFWGRFGKIGVATMNLSTLTMTTIAPQTPASEIMSAQAWRR